MKICGGGEGALCVFFGEKVLPFLLESRNFEVKIEGN